MDARGRETTWALAVHHGLRCAQAWIASLATGLDGHMAKRLDLAYQAGERTGMQKWKRMRTADCVVGGFVMAPKRASSAMLLGY